MKCENFGVTFINLQKYDFVHSIDNKSSRNFMKFVMKNKSLMTKMFK